MKIEWATAVQKTPTKMTAPISAGVGVNPASRKKGSNTTVAVPCSYRHTCRPVYFADKDRFMRDMMA